MPKSITQEQAEKIHHLEKALLDARAQIDNYEGIISDLLNGANSAYETKLLDEFAGKAMQGMLSENEIMRKIEERCFQEGKAPGALIAQDAYYMAREMMKAREET